METLQIVCLGGLKISLGDVPLTRFSSNKSKALLCYLAVTGQEHSRSAVAGFFWPELPEANARRNLRKALSNLRGLVNEHILADRNSIRINHDVPLWLDVTQFETATIPDATIPQLEQAVSLFQGDFLWGFDVRGTDAFEEWSVAQRARLRQLVVSAYERLVNHYARERDHPAVMDHARHLLTIEPWHEGAHRELIASLARNGQRGAALMQCEACRQVLWQELQIEPAADTQAVCEAVRQGELAPRSDLKGPGPFSVHVEQPARRRHNLPLQPTPFVGRTAELDLLDRLLTDPDARLITILGIGGMGKTRLALTAAERQQDNYADGIYFITLAALESSNAILPTIAQALEFPFRDDRDLQVQLQNYLHGKELLLIMDNFEHLFDGATIISDLLVDAPGLRILVTSRAGLSIQGEHLFHLTGMTYPELAEDIELDRETTVSPFDAVNMFLQAARRARPDYTWMAEDDRHVADICRLVQGMPLALLLAASWMEMLTPVEIAAELSNDLAILATPLKDAPARHHSMEAIFDSSWNLLNAQEQKVFAAASVFRGGFSRRAAEEVTGASLRDLLGLVNKALLSRDGDGRFAVHELLRQLAAAHLAQDTAAYKAVRDRHSVYYCTALADCEADWKGGKEVETFADIKTDFENVRNAWNWAARRGMFSAIDQALESMSEAYIWQTRYHEGEEALAQAAEELQRRLPAEQKDLAQAKHVLARVLIRQAEFSREFRSRHETAVSLLQQAGHFLEEATVAGVDTRRTEVHLLAQQVRAARTRGDPQRAWEYAQRCEALAVALDDREWIAYITGGNAWGAFRVGQYEEARSLFQKALALWQEQGNTMYATNLLAGLGIVAMERGELHESERLLRQSMALDEWRGRVEKIVNLYAILGSTLVYSGKFDDACALLEEGLALYTELGRFEWAASVEEILANAKRHSGFYIDARDLAGRSHAYWLGADLPPGIAYTLVAGASVCLAMGEVAEAQRQLRQSTAWLRQFQRHEALGQSLALLALAEQKLDHELEARKALCEALQLSCEARSFTVLINVLPVAAYLLAATGEQARAAEVYALANSYPLVARSRWFQDVVAPVIPAVEVASVAVEPQALWQTADALLPDFLL